ncbi:YgdI/YgdR family lipoprotein [Oceaniglobus trochenteri]|uniref:YgdI/YgdR family lipoprotein n=1 Tax=Oceaniglobus trochenteri TaxID=2763260 RepID=UPI001CFF8B70|nr:YgdI/YgdR family lipoprotein [Oceaniglobus trochenteri]
MKQLAALALSVCALALAGCDSPSIAFQGVPAQSVTVGPSTFSVRVRGDRAEAMRVSRERWPAKPDILARGEEAIRRASGCGIAKNGLSGDQAIVRARLDCG